MARTFDSTTDRITFGTAAMPTTGSITLWFFPNWVDNDGVSHEWFMAHAAEPSPGSFRLLKFSNGNFFGGWYTAGVDHRVVLAHTSYTVNSGAWNHLALTWNDTSNVTTAYLNGTSIGSFGTLVTFTTTQTLTIGNSTAESGGNLNFDGDIAEFGLYNADLTAGEVTALSKGFAPTLVRPQSLVNYLPLLREVIAYKGPAATDTTTAVAVHPRIIYPTRPQIREYIAPAAGTAVKDLISSTGLLAHAR